MARPRKQTYTLDMYLKKKRKVILITKPMSREILYGTMNKLRS